LARRRARAGHSYEHCYPKRENDLLLTIRLCIGDTWRISWHDYCTSKITINYCWFELKMAKDDELLLHAPTALKGPLSSGQERQWLQPRSDLTYSAIDQINLEGVDLLQSNQGTDIGLAQTGKLAVYRGQRVGGAVGYLVSGF
jgi:hypothetical protein